jgi:hypothetical protein
MVYDDTANVVKEAVRASTRHEAFDVFVLMHEVHRKHILKELTRRTVFETPIPVVQRSPTSLPLFNAHHRHHLSICRYVYLISFSVFGERERSIRRFVSSASSQSVSSENASHRVPVQVFEGHENWVFALLLP